jgi:hypothetical protein
MVAPADFPMGLVVLLDPHLASNVHRRSRLEIGRCRGAINLGESMIAVAPDGNSQHVSVMGLFGETIIRKSLPLAEKLLGGDLVLQPCGGDVGSHLQGMMPYFPHHFQAVECTYCRHNVGGIRALYPTRFE